MEGCGNFIGPYPCCSIITGDAKDLAKAIPDESVDLIFTDPPYPHEYLYLYEWLAQQCYRLLKPDGFVLTYVAPYHKDTIMSLFRESGQFAYYWDYIEYFSGNSTIIWPRNTISRYKSILAYRPMGSQAKCRHNVLGVLPGNKVKYGDKRFHRWGQFVRTARYYIDFFSKPGEVVLDPFVGAGTTPIACGRVSRHYLAFEIEPDMAERARERVRNTQPPLFVMQPQQATYIDEKE